MGEDDLDVCDEALSQSHGSNHDNIPMITSMTVEPSSTAVEMAVAGDIPPASEEPLDDSSAMQQQQEMDKQQQIMFSSSLTTLLESLQQENEALKQENHALSVQVHQLSIEINELHKKLGDDLHTPAVSASVATAAAVGMDAMANHHSVSQEESAMDAVAAQELANYQSALTLSETQKSQLLHENHILRERCMQAGIPITDVVSSMVVAPPLATGHHQQHHHQQQQPLGVEEGEGHGNGGGVDVDVVVGGGASLGGHDHPVLPLEHQRELEHEQQAVASQKDGIERGEKTSRSQEKWESHFDRLVQYKRDHGNCLVPTSTELGRWLCRQRHNFKYKSLKEDRKERLMALDKTCLGERVAELGVYSGVDVSIECGGNGGDGGHEGDVGMDVSGGDVSVAMDGDQMVGSTAADNVKGNSATASWGATSTLMNAKTKYNYAYETKLHAKWNKFFKQLEDYKAENGHCNYPTMNGSLGRWISRQRTLYRSKKLKTDRYEKLVSIGFMFEDATALEFRGKLDQQWDDMYNRLVEHKESKGHCFDVPENLPLGKWLYRQRWLYRHGNLRKDRAEKLLAIGFEDKKVLKRASDDDDDGMSGEQSFKKKKRKMEVINNTHEYEPGPSEEDETLEQFDDADTQFKSETEKNTPSPSCGGVASV
jgi:hypothetical protein